MGSWPSLLRRRGGLVSESQAQTLNSTAFYTLSGRTIHGQTREGIWAIIRDLLSCFDFYFVLFYTAKRQQALLLLASPHPPRRSVSLGAHASRATVTKVIARHRHAVQTAAAARRSPSTMIAESAVARSNKRQPGCTPGCPILTPSNAWERLDGEPPQRLNCWPMESSRAHTPSQLATI